MKRSHYEGQRYWYLHELRQLRAQRRYGARNDKEAKAVQRTMAQLRGTHYREKAERNA